MKRKIIKGGKLSLKYWTLPNVDDYGPIGRHIRREIEEVIKMIFCPSKDQEQSIYFCLPYVHNRKIKNPLALDMYLTLDGETECITLREDLRELILEELSNGTADQCEQAEKELRRVVGQLAWMKHNKRKIEQERLTEAQKRERTDENS